MFGSPAPTPQPPALPAPLPSAPTYAQGASKGTGANRPASSLSTIMTSPSGDTSPTTTAKKSLLGQ